MKIPRNVLDWLLEEENASVRYRTMRELLDLPDDDPTVVAARNQIGDSKPVVRILDKMHPDGYWLQKNPRSGEVLGDGIEYGSMATTHFCLAYLAELGLDVNHPQVSRVADRYLNLQQPDGDFWNHMSCLYGYNIRTFVQLGLGDDPRVRKAIKLMIETERQDGGYLCDMHDGKYKTREVKSCIRGVAKVLMAFAELPEYHSHPRCKAVVDYFLRRDCLFKSKDLKTPVQREVTQTVFPLTWGAGLIDILYGLSKLGYGRRKAVKRAWDILEEKRDEKGRYHLDFTHSYALLKPGKRGEPNKWITFYALLARRYRVTQPAAR